MTLLAIYQYFVFYQNYFLSVQLGLILDLKES